MRRASSSLLTVRVDWLHLVNWVKADALDPASLREHMNGAQAVVHSVGALFSFDYKRFLNPQALGSPGRVDLEEVNRDTAINAAKVAESAGVPAFVFISAVTPPAFVPIDARYTSSKREVERHLLTNSHMRPVILRPGALPGSDTLGRAKASLCWC